MVLLDHSASFLEDELGVKKSGRERVRKSMREHERGFDAPVSLLDHGVVQVGPGGSPPCLEDPTKAKAKARRHHCIEKTGEWGGTALQTRPQGSQRERGGSTVICTASP